jgi:hypothetical protein
MKVWVWRRRRLPEGADEIAVGVPGGVLALLLAGQLADDREERGQDARCAAVGERFMSVLTSAMIIWVAVTPTPGMPSGWATA